MRSKKIILFLLVCTMLLTNSISVMAAKPQKGSIEIILTDGDIGTSKEDVVFEYAKVADVIDGQYVLMEEYEGVDLNTIKYSAELDAAAQKLNEEVKAEGKAATDQEGKATISDLDIGVYLLRVSDRAGYDNVTPVLISIPTWNEEQGTMEFHVTLTPKHSPVPKEAVNESVQTGDDAKLFFWKTLSVGSFVCAIVAFLYCIRYLIQGLTGCDIFKKLFEKESK